jgi:hypothetical protein
MRNINLYQNPVLYIAYFYLDSNEIIINNNCNEKKYKEYSMECLLKEVQYKNVKLDFNHPLEELIFNLRLKNRDVIENNNDDTIENINEDIKNENIQINEIIYLDIKSIFIINKYIDNDNSIYI